MCVHTCIYVCAYILVCIPDTYLYVYMMTEVSVGVTQERCAIVSEEPICMSATVTHE
jgi:hypothetical protein